MHRASSYIFGSLLLVVGFLLGWNLHPGLVLAPTASPVPSEAPVVSPNTTESPDTVSVMLDFGDGTVRTFHGVNREEHATVFALMKALSETGNGFVFQYQPPGEYGTLVETIGNKKGGEDGGKFWLFWVNNVLAEQAADRTPLAPGDVIEWKFVRLAAEGSAQP